jgi:transcriptional regulator with XRE-family HTH domain
MRVDGGRLREMRESRGLSQVELARKASITKGFVSMLEGGSRMGMSPSVAARIAQALGVAIADLRPPPGYGSDGAKPAP